MISDAERRKLLVEWNDTQKDYPKNRCIHEIFEAQAEKTPDAIAVLFDCKQLTYRELNTRANQLAHYLRVLEVGPEIRVGVCMERSLEMVIGILGILKAGGAYVPLDPAYPKERLAFMLEDAHLSVLLTQQSLVAKLPQHHGRLVCLDADGPMIGGCSEENPADEVTAENLAYLIYTSGSTGVPKGVAIEHHSAVTLLHWAMDVFAREETRGVLASTSICFDLSVFEMFLPLSHGGKVILVENALHLSTLDAATDVTLINTVPSTVAELLRSGDIPPSVQTICLAGEPLSPRLVERIYEHGTVRQVFDLYGPSEDTTYSTFALRHPTGPATIGRPIANTQVYILDHHMQPVPIGVAGELFIGGGGLARGYLNRPEASAEKFLPNPFSDEPGRRLYRTGDSARYLPDGKIEFLGRIDNQVKIRGFRIELGEIETVLVQHSGVGQAVVLAWGDTSSDKQLVAYVVPNQTLSPSIPELRDFLANKLPFYMVPSSFVSLEALPLTPNGKIDRRALPAPDRVRPETVNFAPVRNPIEEVVAGIWTEVLKLERIGVHDNFFELGGHSLLATRVISRLRRTFRRDFPLRLLFEAPTIASLATLIETTRRNEGDSQFVPPLLPISRHGHLPLSFAQQRLWVLDRLEPGNPTYNMPAAVRLTGTLDNAALDRSLNEIVRRHEALRTTFAMVDGEPIQVIAPSLTIAMSVVDLQELPLDKRELRARQMMTEEAKSPFDLAQGPLLRSALIRLGSQHHILLVTMHHIVSDGWSMGVFFHELSVLYQAYSAGETSSLPELPIQYKDFALWQRQWLQGESLTTQLSYWKQQLEAAPVLALPTDRPRSPAQTYRGARHSLVLSKALSDALTKLSHQENVTLFMTLLAAFQILLQRYSGQSDITVGSPIAGRHQIEVEGLIGFFLNSLVLRGDLSGNPTFRELLARVRQVALDAYTHQDLPFEKLLEELRPDRDLSRTPLFQVFFNMLEFGEDNPLNLPGVTAELLEFDEPASNFDLTLYAGDRDGAVWFSLVYNPDLFEPTTISRLMSHYHNLLEAITANSQQRIWSLPLLSEAERNQLRARRNRIAPANSFIEFKKDDIEQSISARFEKMVNVNPNQVAVKTHNYRWTYADLNRAANQIARTILRSCDGGEERIALLFEHDAPMIAAILGVLKSGNAYVPLDLNHPKERLAYILEDSQATALLTTRNTVAVAKMLTTGPVKIIDINEIDDAVSTANLGLPILPDALAYILYTSGSTGQPKGVVQNQRNVLHHIVNYTNGLHLNPDDKLTLIPSYGFDAAVMDMFGALLNGATLYPLDVKEEDRTALLARMVEEKITIYHSTPTVYRYLLGSVTGKQDLSAIRLAVLGGEEVLKKDVDLFRRHFSVNAILVNGLGPTESTLALQYFIDHETRVIGNIVPVGYAVADTEILLLDEAGEQTEIYGEIAIRSDHLALGYWQKPEITKAAFLPDPESGTKRVYRTGDMGRLLSNGTIAFTGRKDFQVKIRGVRIEPGEIEATLGQHPGVRECVVLAYEDVLDDKRLVVYIVANQQRAPSAHDLRSFLKQKLPDYMVPSAFVYLDSLPLTPNGKVDRKALPSPDQSVNGLEERYVAPRSSVEEILVGIWVDVLKLERVGIHDNFFELGGHSLLATQVIARLRKAMQIELPLRALFEAPTIAGLAKGVEESQRATQIITSLAIPAISRDGDLPLSFAQARLWFLDQLEPNSSVYNLANGIRLKGTLSVAALERSLNEIVRRHEALRTSFSMVQGQPIQVIASSLIVPLPLLDLSNLSETEREVEAQRLADEENQRAFDLARGPILRSKLMRLGNDDHVLLVTMHHIVSDGWSMGVLFRELSILYEAFSNGKPSPLADLPIQYVDYAVWQREWLQGEVLETQLSYWKKQLENIPALQLPTDRRRPTVQSYRGAGQSLGLSKALSDQVKALSRKEGATLFMTLLAAFQILLYRYTGQEDIVMGSPIAGRTRAEMEGLIGFLVNTLVLRGDLSGNPTFRELLARVREAAFEAYAHQDVPFEKLVEELQPQRNLSHSPLFQVMFVLQNAPATALKFEGLSISPTISGSDTAKFDLTLSIREESGGLRGHLQYNTDLFEGTTVERMLSHFENLLKGIVADPDQQLSNFPLLTQAERHQLLVEWNDTKRDYPEDKCVHQLFEEQVERTPDAIAVVYEGQELTYREINQRANQLAHYLIRLGVGPEQLVGVFMERSPEMVVAVLGILKAGGAYVPLDHESPKERLAFFLQDTKTSILVTQQPLIERLPSVEAHLLCLDPDWVTIRQERIENPILRGTPTRLAYVTYTSGSTGQPKGVMIEHRSLVNYLHWVNSYLLNDDIGTVPMITEITFDACLKQLFAPLLCGKQVWLVPRDLVIQPAALLQEIRKKVRVGFNCVPSLWAAILNEIDSVQAMTLSESLTCLFLGGERLSEELVGKSITTLPALRIWNLYGPTETTANASNGKVVSSDKVTIGNPVSNTEIYLLDNQLQPVPAGVTGEVYIGGVGLARGYLNGPELTAEKFIASPFSSLPGARLYRTEDLARYLSDGSIEFIGRIDHQVKIRGFRIELGEIESALRQHPSVRDGVVLAREDVLGDKRLVAYIVSNQQLAPSTDNLRSFLKQKLPEYMLPTIFVFLDSVPLFPNGKVDRRALPPPDQSRLDLAESFVAPRTSVEDVLAGIWAEVLKVARVGIHDNFFELGGHSLLATQVIARLRKAMQIELPLRALFEAPTIAGLAKGVEESQRATQIITSLAIPAISRDGDLPLSFAQARLWFLDQLEPNSSVYNLANGIRLKGTLSVAALERSLNEIVRRHEALRTSFSMVQGQPIQVIASSLIVPLPLLDLSNLSETEREVEAQRLADEENQRAFDLARGPLLRSKLMRLGNDDHVLLVTMHHIVSDGWSMGVLFRELSILYEAFSNGKPSPLADLPIQYVDYAVWQREWLQGEQLERQLAYWNRQLAGAPAVLHLPADRPRPPIQTFRGAKQPVSIPKSLSQALKALSHREGATLFMTLLAAFKVLLSRYTGETDIVVGTPIAGRTHSKSEGLIGFFANTLVLRTDVSGDPIFRALLKRVKEIALEAYAHQELPFEKLVELLQPERDLSYNPLFQILFALNNTRTPVLELPGLSLSRMQLDSGTARFDLALDLFESPEGLIGSLEYNTDLFDAATVSRMAGHFETLLATIVSDPSQRLSTLYLLTKAERQKLLVEWNGRAITQGHDLCLNEMFEAQVKRAPESVAVVCEGNRLTYRELNGRANQLAHYLTKLGVKPEVPVGICVERSVEMLVGLLAILKAGGAYVPLDPAYPAQRLAFMLDDIQAPLLLTQHHILERLPRQREKVICLDADWEIIAEESEENLSIRMTPENLAYVIYTSGSTGRPKGVQICHRSVYRLLEATRPLFGFDEHDVWTVFHSATFDFSVWEIWGALLQGGRLVVVPLQVAQSPADFHDLLRSQRVTVLNQTPSAMRQLIEASPKVPKNADDWSLRLIICGGEAFPRNLASPSMEWGVSVWNFYGPTEATVWAAINPITSTGSKGESIPIGRPIADRQIYLLDENLQPVPVGVPGELHIGGAGLARGYFKRPELTAETFIPYPFSNDPGARLYRTGDLARYLSDGNIEFLGRIDHQVKIRGFRIELGEIESTLSQHPAVPESVVLAREDSDDKRLVAYIVSNQQPAPSTNDLRSFLKQKLPDYMVPSAFVFLDSLPLTPNGKVDRRALPAPDQSRPEPEESYVAPRTQVEEGLAKIWTEVLRLERVGIHDNFFNLGGHSLKATQVMSRLREVFQVEMPLRNLFEHPTVARLAESLEAIGRASNRPRRLAVNTTTARETGEI